MNADVDPTDGRINTFSVVMLAAVLVDALLLLAFVRSLP